MPDAGTTVYECVHIGLKIQEKGTDFRPFHSLLCLEPSGVRIVMHNKRAQQPLQPQDEGPSSPKSLRMDDASDLDSRLEEEVIPVADVTMAEQLPEELFEFEQQ